VKAPLGKNWGRVLLDSAAPHVKRKACTPVRLPVRTRANAQPLHASARANGSGHQAKPSSKLRGEHCKQVCSASACPPGSKVGLLVRELRRCARLNAGQLHPCALHMPSSGAGHLRAGAHSWQTRADAPSWRTRADTRSWQTRTDARSWQTRADARSWQTRTDARSW